LSKSALVYNCYRIKWSHRHRIESKDFFCDWQRKAEVGNKVSVGVQYETEERRKQSVASMTVVCKDCQVQTGKQFSLLAHNAVTKRSMLWQFCLSIRLLHWWTVSNWLRFLMAVFNLFTLNIATKFCHS